jgi:hypothetical protein
MIKVIDGTPEAELRQAVPGRSLPRAVFDPDWDAGRFWACS